MCYLLLWSGSFILASLHWPTFIKGLLPENGVTYISGDLQLFIDSSKRSLKCVLLHNGNVHGLIIIGHSV